MFTQDFINSPLGQAAMAYAESVYVELFNGGEFTLADHPDMQEDLIQYHMEPVYEAVPARPFRHFDEDYVDDYFDNIEPPIISEGLSREEAEKLVQTATYVWVCNYKGEQEGPDFLLKDFAKNMRIYHGKWDYSPS